MSLPHSNLVVLFKYFNIVTWIIFGDAWTKRLWNKIKFPPL